MLGSLFDTTNQVPSYGGGFLPFPTTLQGGFGPFGAPFFGGVGTGFNTGFGGGFGGGFSEPPTVQILTNAPRRLLDHLGRVLLAVLLAVCIGNFLQYKV